MKKQNRGYIAFWVMYLVSFCMILSLTCLKIQMMNFEEVLRYSEEVDRKIMVESAYQYAKGQLLIQINTAKNNAMLHNETSLVMYLGAIPKDNRLNLLSVMKQGTSGFSVIQVVYNKISDRDITFCLTYQFHNQTKYLNGICTLPVTVNEKIIFKRK